MGTVAYFCRTCSGFEPLGVSAHRCSSNTSNRRPDGPKVAEMVVAPERSTETRVMGKPRKAVPKRSEVPPKQGWNRADYNAYMKDYMAKRRANAKA